MAITVGEFTTRFPEFSKTEPSLIEASIVDAELMIDRNFYGKKADMAVTYFAAHLIATNPLATMARLDKKEEDTLYLKQYERVKRSLGAGCRVI